MKKSLKVILLVAVVSAFSVIGISQLSKSPVKNVVAEKKKETTVIPSSIAEQLTIVSFNVRDVKGTNRSLEDFQELARMIGGADIIVFQELGAKGFRKSGDNESMLQRFHAMAGAYKAYLGDEWKFVFAPTPTPIELGMGAELPCVAYRTKRGNLTVHVDWKEYFDLGERRDMGMFNVTCGNGVKEENFVIGSVHTKPDAPGRVEELNRIADYIDEHVNEKFIIMGDMNWGYRTSMSRYPDGYSGENRISKLHEDGKLLQVFHDISYTGPGKDEDLRTNLEIRKVGQMYDQFLVCQAYSEKMSAGNTFGKDCGFYSFSKEDYFQDAVDDEVNSLIKGYKAFLKREGIKVSSEEGKEKLKEMKNFIESEMPPNEGPTHRLSDHKPIWMQLTLF